MRYTILKSVNKMDDTMIYWSTSRENTHKSLSEFIYLEMNKGYSIDHALSHHEPLEKYLTIFLRHYDNNIDNKDITYTVSRDYSYQGRS